MNDICWVWEYDNDHYYSQGARLIEHVGYRSASEAMAGAQEHAGVDLEWVDSVNFEGFVGPASASHGTYYVVKLREG